jgi:hypothetical protein
MQVKGIVESDSSSALAVTKRRGPGSRLRHVEVKYFFVQALVMKKVLLVRKVSSEENDADIGTKIMDKIKFEKICQRIGLAATKDDASTQSRKALLCVQTAEELCCEVNTISAKQVSTEGMQTDPERIESGTQTDDVVCFNAGTQTESGMGGETLTRIHEGEGEGDSLLDISRIRNFREKA